MTFKLLHLATFAAISVVLAGIGGVAVTYLVVEEEVRDLIDDDLEAQAEFFAALISDQRISMSRQTVQSLIDEAFEPDPDDVGDIQEMLWITVYDRTSGAHISNLKHELPLAQPGSGSITRELLGHEWYGHQHDQSGGPIVQLLHHSDRYREIREEVLEDVLLPAIAVVGVNVTLLAGLVYLSLWPMTRLARQIEQRPAASLYPVELSTPAREVAVLRDALNGYIRAVDEVLIREREFASDVAHELRTPLTTLRLELSSASVDMESMQSEVERMIALVSQLLTLARLERSSWREASEPVPLHVVIGDLVASMEEVAPNGYTPVKLSVEEAWVLGDRTLLEILVQNLLSNVRRHCPAGTEAEIRLHRQDSTTLLTILDNGPGLDSETLAALNRGAVRFDKRRPGTGLGISICRKIADIHHATLSLANRDDGQTGLAVSIEFPESPG